MKLEAKGKETATFNFEYLIFKITRWFSLIVAAIVIISLCILGIAFFGMVKGVDVSYTEVLEQIDNTKQQGVNNDGPMPIEFKVEIPGNVKSEFLDEQNKRVLTGWLDTLDTDQQKQFLDNMSAIIRRAKEDFVWNWFRRNFLFRADMAELTPGGLYQTRINPTDAINAFKTLWLEKSKKQPARYEVWAVRAGYAAAVFALLVVLALVCTVLILLALERNTRGKVEDEAGNAQSRPLEKLQVHSSASIKTEVPEPVPTEVAEAVQTESAELMAGNEPKISDETKESETDGGTTDAFHAVTGLVILESATESAVEHEPGTPKPRLKNPIVEAMAALVVGLRMIPRSVVQSVSQVVDAITDSPMNRFLSRAENLCALGLIIFFFFPWINIGGIITVSGFSLPDIVKGLARVGEAFTEEKIPTRIYLVYIVYLIPLFSVMTIVFGLMGKDAKVIGYAAALVPIMCAYRLAPGWARESIIAPDSFVMLGVGAWLTLTASVVMVLSVFEVIRMPNTEKRPVKPHLRGIVGVTLAMVLLVMWVY